MSEADLKGIRSVAAAVPAYPGSTGVGSYQRLERFPLFIGTRYRADANYEVLKRFYLDSLAGGGWEFEGEETFREWGKDLGGRQLLFKRDEYQIFIVYAGDGAQYAWNYAVDIRMAAK